MQTGNGNGPIPTNELGYLINDATWMPTWFNLAADDLEENNLLVFPESIRAYSKMLRTDGQLQGLANGCLWPIFRMRWYLDENGANPAITAKQSEDFALPVGKLAPGQKDDPYNIPRTQNRFKFIEHMAEALDGVLMGVQIFEQSGAIQDDGLFHLLKLAPRPGYTIAEAKQGRDGGIKWLRQHGYDEPNLDISRLVLYNFQKRGANWTGRSMLRGAYAPWLLKDRAMRIGVMNLQRAGVGTPVIEGHPGASDADLIILNRLAEKFKAGDRSGGAIPAGAKLRLVGVEGSQPDSVGFIKLMNEEMSRAFLQMFMQLGQSQSGSRALGSAFIDWHKMTLEYIANWFMQIFSEHVIEDDVEWNYGPEERYAPLLRWQWNEEDPSVQDPTQKLRQSIKNGKVQTPNDVQAQLEEEAEIRAALYDSRDDVARRGERRATRVARTTARVGNRRPTPLPGHPLRRHEIEVKLS